MRTELDVPPSDHLLKAVYNDDHLLKEASLVRFARGQPMSQWVAGTQGYLWKHRSFGFSVDRSSLEFTQAAKRHFRLKLYSGRLGPSKTIIFASKKHLCASNRENVSFFATIAFTFGAHINCRDLCHSRFCVVRPLLCMHIII